MLTMLPSLHSGHISPSSLPAPSCHSTTILHSRQHHCSTANNYEPTTEKPPWLDCHYPQQPSKQQQQQHCPLSRKILQDWCLLLPLHCPGVLLSLTYSHYHDNQLASQG